MLTLLALLASVYTLRWASAVFIPLLLGLMASYALSPAVNRLQRWYVPRALGAAVLLSAILGGVGSIAPQAGKGVTRVQMETPHFNIKDYLWSGTLGLVGFVGQAMVVCFITYFLIISGDGFRRKVVRVAGPTFSGRRVTLQVLDEITAQIERHLMVQIATSVLVGLVTWIALLAIGLERAAAWGVAAGLLNLVPYIGSIVVTAGLALAGFLQFGTPSMALMIGAISLAIHTISGHLLSPWLSGRASRMNPVVIFVGVLAWGWLWGIWGLLLGAPMLVAVKAVCDRVDDLKPEWANCSALEVHARRLCGRVRRQSDQSVVAHRSTDCEVIERLKLQASEAEYLVHRIVEEASDARGRDACRFGF
jgi:predicted PurR-regulated permease PerM